MDGQKVLMASPEKALVDFLYLSPARSHIRGLARNRVGETLQRKSRAENDLKNPDRRRRVLVAKRFEQLLESARV